MRKGMDGRTRFYCGTYFGHWVRIGRKLFDFFFAGVFVPYIGAEEAADRLRGDRTVDFGGKRGLGWMSQFSDETRGYLRDNYDFIIHLINKQGQCLVDLSDLYELREQVGV